ncbi:MAG: recombinase family protein [Defluviitaleaceae bacterium]|nr:recombinase family protein [Defluviitaleaceae bacterium]
MNERGRRSLSTGIYVRVSTDEQAQEGFSIRAQVEKLKSYALLKEWDIFDIYSDEGISGKNIEERPAINRLINDINEGNVNNVLVYKVDRLTRSTKNLLELVELFEECNCAFNSLTESIDTDTPSGRMFLKIIGIFAEFERENITMRSRLGRERKVKEGYTLASWSVSYGYTRIKGQKIQIIHPGEAEVVKEIFSMFLDKNVSMNKIAIMLNKRKIPTKMMSQWNSSTVRQILLNPTYVGKVRYCTDDEDRYFEADGHHEPIISDETFYLAGEKIKNLPSKSRTKTPREESYFCGILYCKRCKGKFTTHNYRANNDEITYSTSYRCRTKKSCGVDKCISPDISHKKMEIAFCEYIQRINDISEIEDIEIEESTEKAEQILLNDIVNNEKKIDVLLNRKNQAMEQYMQGHIEFDEYKRMVRISNENSEIIENELVRQKTELSNLMKIPKVLPEDIVLSLQQNWKHLSNVEKAIFFQKFVNKIIITVEKGSGIRSVVRIDNIEFHSDDLIRREKVRENIMGVKGLMR